MAVPAQAAFLKYLNGPIPVSIAFIIIAWKYVSCGSMVRIIYDKCCELNNAYLEINIW